jgi:5-methylcytosine-specific restriction endonuclease McrA
MPKSREEYNAYMAEYMKKRCAERRAKAVQQLGGKCVRCGSTENLEFDHIVAGSYEQRSNGRHAMMWTFSEKRLQEELKKCQLLCHDCHLAKTKENNEYAVPWNQVNEHGTEAMYCKGCHCESCKDARHEARVRRGEIITNRRRPQRITEHGGGTQGIRSCKCDLCRKKRAEYMNNYRKAAS